MSARSSRLSSLLKDLAPYAQGLALLGLVVAIAAGLAACGDTESPEATDGPAAVVESYYAWHIDAAGFDPETGIRGNPMVDGTYRDRPELSESFVSKIDDLVASGQMMADPFLCAQDVPTSVEVADTVVTDGSATATVTTSFEGHGFDVDLEEIDGEWKIVAVHCGP